MMLARSFEHNAACRYPAAALFQLVDVPDDSFADRRIGVEVLKINLYRRLHEASCDVSEFATPLHTMGR